MDYYEAPRERERLLMYMYIFFPHVLNEWQEYNKHASRRHALNVEDYVKQRNPKAYSAWCAFEKSYPFKGYI